jgi:hypothetical protein
VKKLLVLIVLGVLAGCSAVQTAGNLASQPVNQAAVSTARDTSVALEVGYGAALVAATTWAKLPRCAANQTPPTCSTAAGVLALERRRLAARTALDALEGAIKDAAGSGSNLTALVATAESAVTGYQDVLAAYKGGK